MNFALALAADPTPTETNVTPQSFAEAEIALKLNAQYHENTLLALNETRSVEAADQFLSKLEEYKKQYFHVRSWLQAQDPDALHRIELSLVAKRRPLVPEHWNVH